MRYGFVNQNGFWLAFIGWIFLLPVTLFLDW